jgi:hypothetical protein
MLQQGDIRYGMWSFPCQGKIAANFLKDFIYNKVIPKVEGGSKAHVFEFLRDLLKFHLEYPLLSPKKKLKEDCSKSLGSRRGDS